LPWFNQFCSHVITRLGDTVARKRMRQQASVFLISTGVSLMLLTSGAYRWMHQEQERLIASQSSLVTETSATIAAPQDVTVLSIPKIKLEAAILESTTKKSLLLAPGHVEKTAWPGDVGNSVIAGHRDTFFRRLNELQNGDEILVTRGHRRFHYLVSSKTIVSPSDVSVTLPAADARLTLVTCYPTYYIGPAPKRLIVVATLQQATPENAPQGLFAKTSSSLPATP
jgi:sortase A